MKVRHPQYGEGTVESIGPHTAEIQCVGGVRTVAPETCGLEPAEGRALLSGLEVPLQTIIQETATAILHGLGLGRQDETVSQLGVRWNGGKVVLHPADPTLQTKEVPMDVFFHKIVMMRNNFRVLEQKINSNEKLTDGEKVEMQQYISRCYGSMTTFNLLFRNKEDQFGE
ncbi:MAG TPA: hypothetical protein DCM86_06880 [Verrucomicrobiales bacterium]|nr:hypothetical protein [Verrucomicrobiales bacterium]